MTLLWRWEQTPLEAWRGYTFWKPPPDHDYGALALESSPFRLPPVQPLDGVPGVGFQLGVSDCAITRDVQSIRAGQPELSVTGGRRSGVLLIADGKVVGGYVIRGGRVKQHYRIVLHADYLGRGLSTRMILEWFKRVKRPENASRQKMNPRGARAFISAQRRIYLWARDEGKALPGAVQREIEDRAEEQQIREILAEVERTGRAIKVPER